MQLLSHLYKSEDGVAAVEFALIAPLFLILMLGLVDFGFFINASMKVENATRAAAEYVLKGGSEDSIQADVLDQSSYGLTQQERDSLNLTTELTCSCRSGEEVSCTDGACGDDDYRRSFVTVQMTMPYDTLFPYPGLAESLTVRGRVRLQVE